MHGVQLVRGRQKAVLLREVSVVEIAVTNGDGNYEVETDPNTGDVSEVEGDDKGNVIPDLLPAILCVKRTDSKDWK